jgi:uncharacterized membrane protein YfcA
MDLPLDSVVLLVVAAFVAGTIDAIAGGGGLVTIPALLAVGVAPVAALATNKLQSAVGTAGAVVAFARKGRIDLRRFGVPAAMSLGGSAIGAFLVTQIDPSFLSGFIPLLLIAMVVYFVVGPKMSDEDRHARAGRVALWGTAAAIGCYDGFFGPGTGSFLTVALVALFGLGLPGAIAHAKLLNLASNVAAVAVLVAGGHALWATGLAMAAANAAGGQVGAHVAMRYGGRAARPLLIVVSLALTAKLLANPANPLTAAVLAIFQ